jgi:hypothetical protein
LGGLYGGTIRVERRIAGIYSGTGTDRANYCKVAGSGEADCLQAHDYDFLLGNVLAIDHFPVLILAFTGALLTVLPIYLVSFVISPITGLIGSIGLTLERRKAESLGISAVALVSRIGDAQIMGFIPLVLFALCILIFPQFLFWVFTTIALVFGLR